MDRAKACSSSVEFNSTAYINIHKLVRIIYIQIYILFIYTLIIIS